MQEPWNTENWKDAPGITDRGKLGTNSALAERDYDIACQMPAQNRIGIYRGIHLWWCSAHCQPEMYCRLAVSEQTLREVKQRVMAALEATSNE